MSSVIACLQKVTMTLIYILKITMSSVIACLQRRQCPHLHFKDNNAFSHCMPSKGDNVFIYISKMTMSSVIACLERWQCSHLHFKDDNVFSHCMPLKGDNVFICISKTTMSSPQKLQYFFPMCFIGLDVLCLYTFKKKEKSENENENELNEKRRNFNVFMPSRVLLLEFLSACDLRLTTLICLTPIAVESVKFQDVSGRNWPKTRKWESI